MDIILPHSRGTKAQHTAFGVLAAALVLLGVYTLWNFLSALVWAGIFAIALWPLYHRAVTRFGPRSRSVWLPMLFTLAVALVFIVPLALVAAQLGRESHAATEWVRNVQQNGLPEPDALHHLPFGQEQVDAWWQANLADPGSAKELLERLTAGRVAASGGRSARRWRGGSRCSCLLW